MLEEHGSAYKFRLGESMMHDSEGNVMACKCGKSAASGLIGKSACKAWCSDCVSETEKYSAKFVYRRPDQNDPRYKKALELCEDKKG